MENNILLKKYNFELECALRDYKKNVVIVV